MVISSYGLISASDGSTKLAEHCIAGAGVTLCDIGTSNPTRPLAFAGGGTLYDIGTSNPTQPLAFAGGGGGGGYSV